MGRSAAPPDAPKKGPLSAGCLVLLGLACLQVVWLPLVGWLFPPVPASLPFTLAAGAPWLAGVVFLVRRREVAEAVVVLFFGAVVVLLVPNFMLARAMSSTGCKSNLKNISAALEMYGTDNSGLFPGSLQSLTPRYLKTIPTCPEGGRDTYSSGYQSHPSPAAYTVVCEGDNHRYQGASRNFPQYDSFRGLIEQP
ncbi:MAG TPA: hypothetical protein VNO81_12595 [Candidatus Nitrosotenuis sp.]|nr:hypothetical protein [Candidatus Nitrosotenuis sp.]